MYGNSQFMLDNLARQRDRLDDMIKNYQQPPVNNFITGQITNDLYEVKKLNEKDEVENIAVFKDTIFIGEDRMQIKRLDGGIEKYEIKKVYPRDKKDEKIDELNEKIKELEMRLNGPTSIIEPVRECKQPDGNDDGVIKPTTKTNGKYISKKE